MALQGDLGTLSVRELLGLLCRTGASGRLSLSRGMAVRRFHLRDGRVLLASSSDGEGRLGRLLVERGLIDQAALAQALDARAGAPDRLGKTLADRGLVSVDQLERVLGETIERLLLDTLGWPDGQFYFDEGAVPDASATAVTASFDLASLLNKAPARRSAPRTLVVGDADVIEMRTLDIDPEPSLTPTGGRRRRRAVA